MIAILTMLFLTADNLGTFDSIQLPITLMRMC